jgi:hypothetical protein
MVPLPAHLHFLLFVRAGEAAQLARLADPLAALKHHLDIGPDGVPASDFSPEVEAARQLLCKPSFEPAPAAVLAVLPHLLGWSHGGGSMGHLARLWLASGPVQAVRALLATFKLQVATDPSQAWSWRRVDVRPGPVALPSHCTPGAVQLLAGLSQGLALATEAERDEAGGVARAAFPAAPPLVQRALALLFPDEPGWVDGLTALPAPAKSLELNSLQEVLLSACTTAAQAQRVVLAYRGEPWNVNRMIPSLPTLIARLGEDATPLVLACLEAAMEGDKPALLTMLGYVPGDASVAFLAADLRDKDRRAALEWPAEHQPEAVVRLLAPRLGDGGKDAVLAEPLVARALQQAPDVALPRCPPSALQVLARLGHRGRAAPAAGLPDLEATPEEVPEPLRQLPWHHPKGEELMPVLQPLRVADEVRFTVDDHRALDALLALPPCGQYRPGLGLPALLAHVADATGVCARHLLELPEADALQLLGALRQACRCPQGLTLALRRLGPAAVPALERMSSWVAGESLAQVRSVTQALDATKVRSHRPRLAAEPWFLDAPAHGAAALLLQLFATGLLRDPAAPAARAWLLLFPGSKGLELLIGGARQDALVLAQRLCARDARFAATLRQLAEQGGVSEALEQALARDPPWHPKAPAPVEPETAPPVRLTSGKRLPASARQHLLAWLAAARWHQPTPWAAGLVAQLDRPSLTDWLWALFTDWRAQGAPTEGHWVLTALIHLGGPEGLRRLTQAVLHWPARAGVHSTDAIESLALALLFCDPGAPRDALAEALGMVGAHGSDSQQARLEQAVELLRRGWGCPVAEVRLQLAPRLGLDARAQRTLDFGPRTFEVGFDPMLVPFVREAGERLRDLPRPGKKDDAEKAALAREQWKGLKREVASVAPVLTAALREWMRSGHRLSPDRLRAWVLEHPLLGAMSRGLLFQLQSGVAVRLDPSGAWTDLDEQPHALAPDDRVTLLHPVSLSAADVARWAALLSDYEVIQPFPQLAEPALRLTEPEQAGLALDHVMAQTARADALKAHGWASTGWARRVLKPCQGLWAALEISERTLGDERTTVMGDVQLWDACDRPLPWRTLPPFEVQRLLLDLKSLVE